MLDSVRINSHIVCRATKRLTKELNIISKDPIPGIDISVNENNILEWHFVIHGKEDTPYYGGMYHGKLIFPSNFPFGPPKILFLTPNGRFKTNERICFSLSDFHPEEWKPAFSVTTVLQGGKDFMHDSTETIGSIETSERVKRLLAESSSIHNGKDTIFCQLFPKLCEGIKMDSKSSSNESSKSLKEAIPTQRQNNGIFTATLEDPKPHQEHYLVSDVEISRSQRKVKITSIILKFRKAIKRNIINHISNPIYFLLVCLTFLLGLYLLALLYTSTGKSGINLKIIPR